MCSERQVSRVLIVSADIGAGHNATGRALEESVRRAWPAAQVYWLDVLKVMGPGVGPVFRRIYVLNVELVPWLYEWFYTALWRFRWFAQASKRFVAEWAGRRLRRPVRMFAPDLVLSTYPLGSAGLEWLRRRGELDAPIGAWISDFAPHPFWVYGDIDSNVVMHEMAMTEARRCMPEATISVGAPPVSGRFVPADKDTARSHLGLPQDAFVALVSCGSLAFGSVLDAVNELLDTDLRVVVLVVCGRNEKVRADVLASHPDDPRLIVYGWTDEVPALLAACDVLVTNAGGVSALEALVCGRAVLMYRPIAAHGRANAELMARAGLAELCHSKGSLSSLAACLIAEPHRLAALEERAFAYVTKSVGLSEQLRGLAAV